MPVSTIVESSYVTNHHTIGFHLLDTPQITTNKPRVALAVIPVALRDGANFVKTFAFLDNGYDCTLIDESQVAELGIQGQKRQLELCTLNEESMFESVTVQIDGAYDVSEAVIHVEQAWSVKTLSKVHPFRPSDYKLSTWQHLREIPFHPYSNSNIGILIGCDVPEAHWVVEQRKVNTHEPYAVNTALGCMMLGPTYRSIDARATVDCIRTDEFRTNLEMLYQQELIDAGPDREKEISVDDQWIIQYI